jgi:hypothetical protein
MQKIFQAIINFFRSIFGGNSAPEVSYIPPLTENIQNFTEKPKAPTEISVLPQTSVTETPEKPVAPKPPIKETPKPPVVVQPKQPIVEQPKTPVVPTPIAEVKIPQTDDANTLIIKLERYSQGAEDILGRIMIAGNLFCYTLEDTKRDEKVRGDTCIPAGKYEITLRTAGAMNDTYSRRFSDIHKGMLWVRNIPNFEYILIHVGNTSADTLGCILVGTKPVNESNVQIRRSIDGSNAAYQKLYPVVTEHISKGGKVFIEIENKNQ